MPVRALCGSRARVFPAAWTIWWVSGMVGVTAIALLRVHDPGSELALPCLFRELTHLSCPTCGLTRALIHLARGDLTGSLGLHPMAIPLVAQLFGLWAWFGLWLAGRVDRRPDVLVPLVLALDSVALGAIWLIRLVSGTLPGIP